MTNSTDMLGMQIASAVKKQEEDRNVDQVVSVTSIRT